MAHTSNVISADAIAQTAKTLIERWGPCPHLPDGEDSSGKQKFRIMSPREIAERALQISEEFEKVMFESGHFENVG